ncbi:nitroreductase family deazaflavin-dependent oxidoreductase [Nocardia sp. NBC_01329]|uniref:nitroreductase family deazaflavin-dependent oxidoreductase n=1 Tax=Nocardia sp. NBC_01329 TaxID=2903594 RepID=UPI002E164B96|nr:nitroreductase family deazaflavin-dependent oxidoreductase [Nocardia sp. NBC_01329]
MSNSRALPAAITDALVSTATRALHNRRLMRAPIWAYRARLGFLFGSRMLMLEHIGRKSGTRRYVVLEVIDRPEPGTYVVVSGFGTRAQWFRNLQANPAARIWPGTRGPAHATAQLLDPDAAAQSLQSYITRHPRAWNTMKPALENTLGAPIDDQGTELPMVALHIGTRQQPEHRPVTVERR